MAHKLIDAFIAVGASKSIRPAKGVRNHTYATEFSSLAATKITAVVVSLQGSMTNEDAVNGVISDPVIAIGSTPEKVANDAFDYRINNVNYSKGAVAAGTTIQTGYDITTAKYGGFTIYIDAAGTITFKFPLTTQAYATPAEVHIALDAQVVESSLIEIGRVLIYNNEGAAWDSQTDDLTDSSDLTTATFISKTSSFIALDTLTFSGGQLTAQKGLAHVVDKSSKYIRLYLSTLTGTGEVSAHYQPVEDR